MKEAHVKPVPFADVQRAKAYILLYETSADTKVECKNKDLQQVKSVVFGPYKNKDEIVVEVKGDMDAFLMSSVTITRASLRRLAVPPKTSWINVSDYWLNDEVKTDLFSKMFWVFPINISQNHWTAVERDIPKQKNNYDCGLFMLKTDIPKIRNNMLLALWRNRKSAKLISPNGTQTTSPTKPPTATPPGQPMTPSTATPPGQPTKPSTATPPGQPTKPSTATPPGQPTKPSTATPPGQPTKPSTATPPGQPTKPSTATPPGQPTKPSTATPPGQPTKPSTATPPGQPTKPSTATPPGQPTKPSTATPPGQPMKPSTSYKYPHCKQKFTIKSNMQRHIKNTHGSNTDDGNSKCLSCDFRCHRVSDLRLHLTSVHGIKLEEETVNFLNYTGSEAL
ncbi:uncharacterized protein LOC114576182 [Exaiptasia diaphana]|uniref:C2H2-type domain-containing protein n=1 Tax=Exaiptasia diaphana TaxID=2652724 RepID=A0A913YSL7_EXADI|nr:uncharacterized protein LOC114576182 [Exaiptasia diaphana]